MYNNCCCKKRVTEFNKTPYEVDPTPGIDSDKMNEIISKIRKIRMKYPKDMDDMVFQIFTHPPPTVYLPSEQDLLLRTEFPCVFVFGEHDPMDRDGAERLCRINPLRFSMYIVSGKGHTFLVDKPISLYNIINLEFPVSDF